MESCEVTADDQAVNSTITPASSMRLDACVLESANNCVSDHVRTTASPPLNAEAEDITTDNLSDTLKIVQLESEAQVTSCEDQISPRQVLEPGQGITTYLRGDNDSFSSFSSTGTDFSMSSAAAGCVNNLATSHVVVTSSGISSNCNSNGSSKTTTLQYSCSHYSPPASTSSLHPSNFYLNVSALNEQAFAQRAKTAPVGSVKEQNSTSISASTGSSFLRQVFSWATKKDAPTSKPLASSPPQVSSNANVTSSRSADFSLFSGGLRPGSSKPSANDEVASTTGLILESRPVGLPKKEINEHEKHRQEFEQSVAAAKRKQQKEAQKRSKQRQEQLKHEEFVAQSLKTWKEEILPTWETMRHTKKTRELWWFGLPPSVRCAVWQRGIGNALNITSELYEICKSRAHDRIVQLTNECASGTANLSASRSEMQNQSLAAGSDQSTAGASSANVNHVTILNVEPLDAVVSSLNANAVDKERSVEVIRLDVSRTFPQLCIFQKGGPYYELLHSVLGAFVCFRPDVGYVQGMSFIAAVLLLNMEPADAFVAFANLLNQPLHLTFFRLDQLGMRAYFRVFEALVKENDVELFTHFETVGLTADIYLTDWVFTMFGKSLPLDLTCRIWDVYMRDSEEFLFRTALGTLRLYREILLNLDFIQGAQFLNRLPDNINGDQLFSSIEQCRVTVAGKSFAQLVAEAKEQLVAEQQQQPALGHLR